MAGMTKTTGARTPQVRRLFTAAGFPGMQSEGRRITGVPGWRFLVTGQQNDRSDGKSIWSELLRLNREEGRTAIIRARAMATIPPPTIEDAQVLIRLGDLIELLAYQYEQERKVRR
jgi:hypothetical protein